MEEDVAAGEDLREWFTSLEAAKRRFNQIVKEVKNDKTYRFQTDMVELRYFDVTPTKRGILDAIERRFRNYLNDPLKIYNGKRHETKKAK